MADTRYLACMLLHALGDTIGFKNGDWEFNHNKQKVNYTYTLEIVFEFFTLGGINGIDLKGWLVSDDTLLHLKTAKAIIEQHTDITKFGKHVTEEYIDAMKAMDGRYPGHATFNKLMEIKDIKKRTWDNTEYDFYLGGSGAAMRTPCIGLVFHGKENRDKLISFSIEASRNTHNSAVGYLGGFTAALFTAFAMEKLPIKRWPMELVKLLSDNGPVEKYIKSTRGHKEYLKDRDSFLDKWKQFITDRFEGGEPKYPKTFKHPEFRSLFYAETYGFREKNSPHFHLPGSGGDDCTIIAYDTLLDCQGHWEKAVLYGMLHVGDSDTTGCLVGAWYGAVYGFGDVPKTNLKHLELKDSISKLAEGLSGVN